jgi:hypothetical protein
MRKKTFMVEVLHEVTPLDLVASQQELALETQQWMTEFAQIVGEEEKTTNPKFTGIKVYKGDRTRYDRIVKMKIMGLTCREIAAIERCSPNTVTAIMQLEEGSKTAEQYRGETAVELATAVKLTIGRIKELLADDGRMAAAGPRDLAYLLKELTEKKELLSGGATHRGEQVDKAETDKMDAMKHAQQAKELLEGELIEAEVISEKDEVTGEKGGEHEQEG